MLGVQVNVGGVQNMLGGARMKLGGGCAPPPPPENPPVFFKSKQLNIYTSL